MNRRKFCKLAAGSALVALFMPSKLLGGQGVRRSCVVSVVRCECFDDLQSQFAPDPEAGPCPMLKSGMQWRVSAGSATVPQGMCPRAWEVLCRNMDSAGSVYSRGKDVIVACPDGIRPVIFKITFD